MDTVSILKPSGKQRRCSVYAGMVILKKIERTCMLRHSLEDSPDS